MFPLLCINQPILLFLATITFLWPQRHTMAKPIGHNSKNYPRIDIRHAFWPPAPYPLKRPMHEVNCFSEMDSRYIVPNGLVTYRLSTADRLANGLCMVRIPTRTRATIVAMSTNNPKSYMNFIAGSSDVHMPLRTEHIHADQHDRYGPWHIACRRAYLVFRSRSAEPEWVSFRLEPEAEADREDDRREDCAAIGHNWADVLMERTGGH